MLRSLWLGASIALTLASPLLHADTVAPGWGTDTTRLLSAEASFAAHDSLPNGNRVVFNGQEVWLEDDAGVVLTSLASGLPAGGFPSFVEVDPTISFVVFGENTFGRIYRVALAGGPPTLLATLDSNYDLAFESNTSAIVSAATCGSGCGNSLYRLDVSSGATTLLVNVAGPSGPVAIASNGDLYYGTSTYDFPIVPGTISIERWSAGQIAAGPFPLDGSSATLFTSGLDGASSMTFDPAGGELFVAESAYLSTSRVTEIDRSGVVVGHPAVAVDAIAKVEIADVAGDGACAIFQPAGRALKYRTIDYNQGTSQITTLAPRRPVLASTQNGDGTLTCTLSGGQPGSTCLVISGALAVYAPSESSRDLGTYVLWTGIPFASIRRAGIHFATDAAGAGSFTFANPPAIQHTRVIQALVRDEHGVFRGASTAAFN